MKIAYIALLTGCTLLSISGFRDGDVVSGVAWAFMAGFEGAAAWIALSGKREP